MVLTPANGQGSGSTATLTLDGGSAGSAAITGFGTRWSRVTLVPTIAGTAGAQVPFTYGAALE